MFFDGNDKVHVTLRRVAKMLDSAGISFAVVGGMAVNAHEHARTTKDVDFLLTNLTTLIQLKLAARRHQDYADVVNLISAHQLDESFQSRLHPSVHADYIECLEEKR